MSNFSWFNTGNTLIIDLLILHKILNTPTVACAGMYFHLEALYFIREETKYIHVNMHAYVNETNSKLG